MTEQGSAAITFSKVSDVEFEIKRDFQAPRELVFQVYTDPKHIPQWWGPRTTTTIVDQMDVRPGGKWRYLNRTDDGRDEAFSGEYREVTPPERLVYTFEWEGMPGHIITDSLTFTEHAGTTTITITSLFSSPEDFEGMMASGAEWGVVETWERLDELLARLQQVQRGN